MAAIEKHQVVIVCGETGSGKTTQLPKIALYWAGAKCNAKPGQKASSLATPSPPNCRQQRGQAHCRRAEDAAGRGGGLPRCVSDTLSHDASVKLMTDGILLAETQTDPLLKPTTPSSWPLRASQRYSFSLYDDKRTSTAARQSPTSKSCARPWSSVILAHGVVARPGDSAVSFIDKALGCAIADGYQLRPNWARDDATHFEWSCPSCCTCAYWRF